MTKTIAVWGNCGAGKSLLTCAIANKLTAHGKGVLVINSDKVTPMLGTYLPFLEEKEAYSIGTLLSGNQISIQSFKNKIHLHKSNDNLGFMGLCKGENSLVYQMNWRTSAIESLVQVLTENQYADYLLFDCTSDLLSDNVTLFALEKCDVVLSVLSPDNRGVSFVNAQHPILKGGNFHLEKHITILNNAYPYSPHKKMQADYHLDYILPHSKDANVKYISGQLIKNLCNDQGVDFERTIEQIVERVKNDA